MRKRLKRDKMPQRKLLMSDSESDDGIREKNKIVQRSKNDASRKNRVKPRIRHISESDSENDE